MSTDSTPGSLDTPVTIIQEEFPLGQVERRDKMRIARETLNSD